MRPHALVPVPEVFAVVLGGGGEKMDIIAQALKDAYEEYPATLQGLLDALSTLRRKAEALDWLDARAKADQGLWPSVALEGSSIYGCTDAHPRSSPDLLSAIEQAKEAGRG